MRDSPGNDAVTAAGDTFSLAWSAGLCTSTAQGLDAEDRVRAFSTSGGNDTADLAAVDFVLEQLGDWLSV